MFCHEFFPSFNYILSLFNELCKFECEGVWSPCSTSFNTYILKLGDECSFTSSFFSSYNNNLFNIITPRSYYNLYFLWNKYIYQIGIVLCRLLFYSWNVWILMLHTHVSQPMILHICDIILLVFDPSFHDFCHQLNLIAFIHFLWSSYSFLPPLTWCLKEVFS